MVSRQTILKNLPTYQNKYAHISDNQSVDDIIAAIKDCHKDFAIDYDKICNYFIGPTEYKTCKNIFNFLRENTNYFIESENEQTVKSPAAILSGKAKIDCKGMALFSCGILDAINRTGKQNIPYCYRFVSDSIFNVTPNHVFCVAFPGSGDNEIWVDAIPQVNKFNERIGYYYSIDKKFKAMSLYKVSGGDFNTVGDLSIPGVPLSAGDLTNIISIASNIFKTKPNPNDWKGWDAQDQAGGQWDGSSVRGWVLNDGSDVANEALNIASYIKANGIKTLTNSGRPYTVDGQGWRDVTLDEIAEKFKRGGLAQEAQALKQASNNIFSAASNAAQAAYGTPLVPGAAPSQAGLNMWLTLALVGGGLFLIMKKK